MKFPSETNVLMTGSAVQPSGLQMLDEKLQEFESCCYAALFFFCFCIAQ